MKDSASRALLSIPLLASSAFVSSAVAQTISGQAEKPIAKLDSAPASSKTIGEVRRVEILAGTEDDEASLQLSKAISDYVFGLKLTTPINKDDKSAKLATLDGLSDSIRAELRLTYTPWRLPPANKRSEKACLEVAKLFEYENHETYATENCGTTLFSLPLGQRLKLSNSGYSDEQITALVRRAKQLENEFDSSFFGDKPMVFYSLTATVGTEDFEFRDPTTLEERDGNETEWAIEASVAFFWFFARTGESRG